MAFELQTILLMMGTPFSTLAKAFNFLKPLAAGLSFFFLFGCGEPLETASEHVNYPTDPSMPPMIDVRGHARYGSQCPLGMMADPRTVPLELWNCPLGLPSVELVEPLQALVLQADCKKMTMDVRGVKSTQPSTAWEILPDGTFYFAVDGGEAQLKNYPSQGETCPVPLTAEVWGKVDCSARDNAKIKVETLWRAIRFSEYITLPPIRPSGTPTPVSTTTPAPNPAFPPHFNLAPTPVTTPGSCKIPPICYFHNITELRQCE